MRWRAVAIAAATLVVAGAIAHQVVADNALTATGGVGVTGPGTASAPLVAGVAELHNGGPWPVTITSITAPGVDFAVSLTPLVQGGAGQSLDAGEWLPPEARTSVPAGESVYLWVSLAPAADHPTALESVDVAYEGPFGLSYVERVTTFSVLAVPTALPGETASLTGDLESLGTYLTALRQALVAADTERLALLMDASPDDARAFLKTQDGVVENMGFTASDAASPEISFFVNNSAVDGLPPFTVQFADYRWRVIP